MRLHFIDVCFPVQRMFIRHYRYMQIFCLLIIRIFAWMNTYFCEWIKDMIIEACWLWLILVWVRVEEFWQVYHKFHLLRCKWPAKILKLLPMTVFPIFSQEWYWVKWGGGGNKRYIERLLASVWLGRPGYLKKKMELTKFKVQPAQFVFTSYPCLCERHETTLPYTPGLRSMQATSNM